MDLLFEAFLDDNLYTDNIGAIWLDTINNKIVVELFDPSEQNISNFEENILEHSSLYFTISEGIIEIQESQNHHVIDDTDTRSTTVHPGAALFSASCYRSIGYRARNRNNQWGFVTASHREQPNVTWAALPYRTRLYTSTRFVGQVTETQLSGIDAAFITLASGLTMSSVTVAGQNSGLNSTNAVVGGSALRVSNGGNSPLTASGRVVSLREIWIGAGPAVNTIRTDNMTVVSGDSGGIVLHGSSGNFSVGGIVVADTLYVAAPTINSFFALSTN